MKALDSVLSLAALLPAALMLCTAAGLSLHRGAVRPAWKALHAASALGLLAALAGLVAVVVGAPTPLVPWIRPTVPGTA
ncbi:hypothetical protein, partial [Enterobacter hormaechei]|uniref:hypothetical protein n=1 Tax=Enterobacter hormaechei TaxID=158836 RepID=UPI001CF685EF